MNLNMHLLNVKLYYNIRQCLSILILNLHFINSHFNYQTLSINLYTFDLLFNKNSPAGIVLQDCFRVGIKELCYIENKLVFRENMFPVFLQYL